MLAPIPGGDPGAPRAEQPVKRMRGGDDLAPRFCGDDGLDHGINRRVGDARHIA